MVFWESVGFRSALLHLFHVSSYHNKVYGQGSSSTDSKIKFESHVMAPDRECLSLLLGSYVKQQLQYFTCLLYHQLSFYESLCRCE